jgi:hypothetical protein
MFFKDVTKRLAEWLKLEVLISNPVLPPAPKKL